jgi:flagellar operon protein (TIGR03826 family)
MFCHEKEEKCFEKVYVFIRQKKNRRATMMEVCSATGVEQQKITRFIKQGRLRVADFPNLWYPCDSCETPIREGKLCESCRAELRKSVESYEKESEFQRRKVLSEERQTYFSERTGDR